MLIRICDCCHEKIEALRIVVHHVSAIIGDSLEYEILDREFCSVHCQTKYIINGMKGKGLDDHIKV